MVCPLFDSQWMLAYRACRSLLAFKLGWSERNEVEKASDLPDSIRIIHVV